MTDPALSVPNHSSVGREALEAAVHQAIVRWSNGDQPKPLKAMVADATLALLPSVPAGVSEDGKETAEVRQLSWSEPHSSHSYPNWYVYVYEVGFEARIDTSKAAMYGKFPLSLNGSLVAEKFDTIDSAKAHAQSVFADRIERQIVRRTALATPSPDTPEIEGRGQ